MTGMQRAGRVGLTVSATLLALACGGDDGPVGSTGSIQVAVSPATLTVLQGGSGSTTVSLVRSGGFTGEVALAVTGLPTGITTTVTPARLSGTVTSAEVDLVLAADVALGTHTATVTATGPGVDQATATYQLTVGAAADFTLAATPATITIPAGASGSTTIDIARTNFTDGVSLSLMNPPAGITGTFSPTPSTTDGSTLLVSVPASVAAGTYELQVRGDATGPGPRTAPLTVTVTAPPTGGTTVEYLFCDPDDLPVFFAYQDGTGAWQPVEGSTSGSATRFAFTLTQGRGGVLSVYRTASEAVAGALVSGRVTRTGGLAPRRARLLDRFRAPVAGRRMAFQRTTAVDEYQTYVVYGSDAELAFDGSQACGSAEPTRIVSGTVAGIAVGQFGIVSLGELTEMYEGGTSPNTVTFTDVPPGTLDLVGSRIPTSGGLPDRIVVSRGVDIVDGGSLPTTIDFDGPASSVPATASVTITGGGTDDLEAYSELVTANGLTLLWFDLQPNPNAARSWAGLAPEAMAANDFHGLVVFASQPGAPGNFRVSLRYVGPVASQSVAFAPAIVVPTVSQVATGTYPRLRFQGSVPAEYDRNIAIDLATGTGTGNTLSILATSAFLTAQGGPLAYDLITPDVASLAGFPLAARLHAGVNEATVTAYGFTGPGIFDLEPALGVEAKSSTKVVPVVVP
ncbi:MAG TPA: hypothetical protein VFZ21_07075 [Gemmatimonadaceae bacterium]|nr:hypothetical protein [Gemmatimonadaceae bacterium]